MSWFKTISQLVEARFIAPTEAPDLQRVAARYAVALTPALARLIDRTDEHDPIARQFLPDARELETRPEELADPIGDKAYEPVPGIVHRYKDRVLLKLVNVCPVYCRFCFRREMVGPGREPALVGEKLGRALDYLRAHPEIWEVILTGGDPFIVPERVARRVTEALGAIPHLGIVRWHTRVPIADPEHVTSAFARAIAESPKTVVVVIHVNHARELGAGARAAFAHLLAAGLPLFSQSVLLKSVNDSADALEALFRSLLALKVKPYYLHQMDLAPGTAHFRVPLERAQEIYSELRRRLSGLALPQFVVDIPGGHGKVPAAGSYIRRSTEGTEIADDRGFWHPYSERHSGL